MKHTKSFSKAALSMEVSAIKKFEILAKSSSGVISLAQGIPSFDTALHIAQSAKKAIDADLVGKYTESCGVEPLRLAIAKKVHRDNGIRVRPSEVLVTHGATEAFMAIFLAILDPEDEIIVPTPGYASHLTQIQIVRNGKKAVEVPLWERDTDWVLDPNRLTKAITKRTKAIVITNPTNPTGKAYSKEELKEIARIAQKHNLYILADEIYEYFVFDGEKHISIGSFPEVADRTISVFGVSKSYAMTGWRIGYIVADQPLIDEIFKIHDAIITSLAVVSQYAALTALEGPQDIVREYKETFLQRRTIVMKTLAKTDKLHLIVPQATYYAFPRILTKIDDQTLAMRLLTDAKVAVVPGSAFGKGGEGHIRISFGAEEDTLREGLRRLVKYLNTEF